MTHSNRPLVLLSLLVAMSWQGCAGHEVRSGANPTPPAATVDGGAALEVRTGANPTPPAATVDGGAALLVDLFTRYRAIQATIGESMPGACEDLVTGFEPDRHAPQHGFAHHAFDAVGETCAFKFLAYTGGGHLLIVQFVGQDEMSGEVFEGEPPVLTGGDALSSIISVYKRSEAGAYSQLPMTAVFGDAEPILLTFSDAGEVLVTTIALDTVPYIWTGEELVAPKAKSTP